MQKIRIAILFLTCILLVGCNASYIQKITPEEVNKIIEKKDESYKIIDVRTENEYKKGHLKNALNIPIDNIEDVKKIIPNLNIRIIVYCRSGARSSEAAKKLKQLGYMSIHDMGGIIKWNDELVIE